MERDYRAGLAPVTYGDALACGGSGVIVSGDALARMAAEALGVDCLVYAGREPGVLGPDGSVVERLSVRGGLPPWLGGAGGYDQTGGMAGKVAEAARVREGIEVRIVGGDSILRALVEGLGGTLIDR
jgi:isopentenyl phosphate kinase